MKKIYLILISIMLILSTAGCSGTEQTIDSAEQENDSSGQRVSDVNNTTASDEGQDEEESSIQVASDGAQMQTDDPAMPTRIIENGTKINMHFGDTIIPGILNDSDTAKALIEMLPYTVHMNSYSHDFCGVNEVQNGVRGEAQNEARNDVASDIAEVTGAKNYTKYADYEPAKAEPASLNISGDGNSIGNAEQIAKWIAEETGGDLFLIQTEYTYPMDYNKAVEVGEGQDADGYHPTLVSHVENMEQYDTVYLVYPIWHYTLSVPVCSFLDEYDLGGKTIYAFAANAGSRFADSISRIQEAEPEAIVIEGVSVSEKEMVDAKEEVLSCVRGFAETNPTEQAESSNDENSEEMENITNMKMNVRIGNVSFTAALEDNAATRELIEMMRQEPVSIDMSDYSGFEKVGSLGRSLTTDNHQTTTSAGDIVLYNGNQIVMFYGSNSWSYTKIGKIENLSGWEEALGSGSITAVFSLAE